MVKEGRSLRKRYSAISNLFVGSKDFVLASLLSALLLLCITPLQPTDDSEFPTFETSKTSGRDSVYEGDWAAYRQLPLNNYYYGCDENFALDKQNDYLAIFQCGNIISIYHNSDWSVLIDTIELSAYVEFIDFSPNGEYLVVAGGTQFEIYQTSDWEWVYSNDVAPDDGSYALIYDLTWSGDGQRLVFSTSNSGGEKMYEGPDWSEVGGTTSSGYFVAHHPSEDILWYVSSDGSGNEYEYENIPFVGYQWVMKRSFTFSGSTGPITSSPDGTIILMNSDYGVSAYSSSDYSELFSSSFGANHATFSLDGNYIIYYENSDYNIYSTATWQRTTSIAGSEQECYYDGVSKLEFSSDDSEILVISDQCYDTFLTGWMPDDDSDGVVNEQDICSGTSEEEESDVKGCAPSQKDTDLDGVNDRDDACPRTATSDSVNSIGCSETQLLDTDGDGVSDSDDLCPDTPATEFSNIYGCSKSQRDVDGDGVMDSLDNCPLYDVEECPNVLSWVISTEPVDGSEDLRNPQWSPKGDLVAAYDADSYNIFILDDTLSFVRAISLQNESQRIDTYSWDPNGEWLLILWESSSWHDSKCGYYIWDAANQSISSSYEISTDCDSITSHAINPDGTRLAVSQFSYDSYNGKTKMFEISNNLLEFEDEDHYPYNLIFSHDGTTLIGSRSGEIFLWDVSDGYLLRSKSIGSFDSMLLSPDGDSIFAWNDETIRVFSFNTLELVSTTSVERKNNENEVLISLAFSRSSELLYVSWVERTYGDGYFFNSSIQTYQVNMDQSLEFITSTDIVNTTYHYWPIISPDENSILVSISEVSNSDYEPGFYLWESDLDGDNITDALDLCEHTNLSENSDETGCSWEQKDDDEDNVINKEDLCFGTPYGMPIDEYGCSDQQVDEDFDGVCDPFSPSTGPSTCTGEDLCLATPINADVNEAGCSWEQEDDDHDGVANGNDTCPNTEGGDETDTFGCGTRQRDNDADGINDFWDLCHDSAAGVLADENGCADVQVDADEDGVCNSGASSVGPSNCTGIDICPGTEENSTVDVNGCAWGQLDDDKDGIINQKDGCPNTANLAIVSPDGCSSWQRDSDNDGIVDALDECAKTPAEEIANQNGCSSSQKEVKLDEGVDSTILLTTVITGGVLVVLLILLASIAIIYRGKGSESFEEPKYETRGEMRNDGREWLEHPRGSGIWYYRDHESNQWVIHR